MTLHRWMTMKKLWGARFKSELHDVAKEFTYSLGTDYALLDSEMQVNLVHCEMLGKTGIISKSDAQILIQGLKEIWQQLSRSLDNSEKMNQNFLDFEDVHTWIQTALQKKIGPIAEKLHTGRSRNDLVSTSTRMYLRGKVTGLCEAIRRLEQGLVAQAEKNQKVVIPGYTHLQRAQVILLAHHLLAYVEMFERDQVRLFDALKRLNECPLGSGALSGSGLPIDREYVAKALGFSAPTRNSVDAVSDRDFAIEIASDISILFMHLSRFAEDLILWSSQEFGFLTFSDEFSTGSSLMPHKKNPDVLELVRGKTGEAYGNLFSLLTTMKGLPLSYNRDMQEDKRPLFGSIRLAEQVLRVLELTVRTASINSENCAKASRDSFLFATDVLEYLVKRKVSFRKAHDIMGTLVGKALESHKTLSGLSLEVYQKHSSVFERDVFDLFDPEVSVKGKLSIGSTRPEFVQKELARYKKLFRTKGSKRN